MRPMLALYLAPALLQAVAMLVDEGVYHRRRGLPRWERLGHPVDTLSVALCYVWLVSHRPDAPHALAGYVALAFVSCLVVTKDEAVHARLCSPGEHWLHALLFVLHPIVFLAIGALWWSGHHEWLVRAQLALTASLMIYQVVYWSVSWNRRPSRRPSPAPISDR
jgi:hypothetical protein